MADIEMKLKEILTLIVVGLLVVSGFSVAVGFTVDDEPQENDPVEIYDWHDLDEIRDDLDGDYILMNDIGKDTEGYEFFNRPHNPTHRRWEPIGGHGRQEDFNGRFDGQGYEIRDIKINRPDKDNIGLFGTSNGMLKNINIINANMSGYSSVGSLVGYNRQGWVSNSSATGDIRGNRKVGGLVGENDAMVYNSYVSVDVEGNSGVGALIGEKRGGYIKNSHYNLDECFINGDHHVTNGALFDEQYQDWIEDKNLDIEDYDSIEYAGGYYEIRDVQGIRDLLGFAWDDEYKFRLVEDIDLSDEPGLYIPYLEADFYGDGYAISNLKLDLPFLSCLGFFGLNNGGNISCVEVLDASVIGNGRVGGLVGFNKGVVSNSHITGDIGSDRGQEIGGLIGLNRYIVSESSSKGNVTGVRNVGGLIGHSDGMVENSYTSANVTIIWNTGGGLIGLTRGGTVKNSYAAGDVSGDSGIIGGLIGQNDVTVSNSFSTGNVIGENQVGGLVGINIGNIRNSYATGDVSGNRRVGGLVGNNRDLIRNSYSIGKVNGNNDTGGLVGQNQEGIVFNSLWNVDTSGITKSDGGIDKTTTEMKDIATYTDPSTSRLQKPWDFIGHPYDDEDIWDIDEEEEIKDGYPFFSWEIRSELKINIVGEGKLEVNGEELEDGSTKEYLDDTCIDLKALPEEDWEFMKWTGDILEGEEESSEKINIVMDECKEITVVFEEKEYDEIPGFTSLFLLLASAIAVAIKQKKSKNTRDI